MEYSATPVPTLASPKVESPAFPTGSRYGFGIGINFVVTAPPTFQYKSVAPKKYVAICFLQESVAIGDENTNR